MLLFVLFVFVVFCGLCFWFCLVSCFRVLFTALGQLDGLRKGPHSLSFAAFSSDGFACFSQLKKKASTKLWNDLTKAMKASDGKKSSQDWDEDTIK